jgi:hypothetical protein
LSNDLCANATPVGSGAVAYDTTAAGTDGASLVVDCGPFGDQQIYNDVWYLYTASCTGTMTATTCEQLGGSADFDSRIALYRTSNCAALGANEIACNDDDPVNACGTGGGGFHSTATGTVTSGEMIIVRLGGFGTGDDGVGNLNLTCATLHPAGPGPFGDSDGDTVPNFCDNCPDDPNTDQADDDADGAGNVCDVCPGANDSLDTDMDGTPDCLDGCPMDPAKTAPGLCGCGVSDVDTDMDGSPDCTDGCDLDPLKTAPGICGCGEPDLDSDRDGTFNCDDGCPGDPNKIDPGQCGCGVADTDTDMDGSADCVDECDDDPLKTAPGNCGCGVEETDPCPTSVPTVSQWGLMVLALLLLVAGKVYFGRRRANVVA